MDHPVDLGVVQKVSRVLSRWSGTIFLLSILLLAITSTGFGGYLIATRPPRSDTTTPPPAELTRSAEWQAWRQKIHNTLTAGPITETSLLEVSRIALPEPPPGHTEADRLRRDQAVADALLSYQGVRDFLNKRFGIKNEFLGTGLSRPLGSIQYGQSTIHEYLVENLPDSHPHVWVWRFNSPGQVFPMPISELIAGQTGRAIPPVNNKKVSNSFTEELTEIQLRVKNKDHALPPMIRFARFDEKFYKNTLGRPEAWQVFTSNLSEVWDLSVQQAAERSGYEYKGTGDTLFIWVYVPYHSNEFAPATWKEVFRRMPEWIEKGQAR